LCFRIIVVVIVQVQAITTHAHAYVCLAMNVSGTSIIVDIIFFGAYIIYKYSISMLPTMDLYKRGLDYAMEGSITISSAPPDTDMIV
jgi:hypothetical protein